MTDVAGERGENKSAPSRREGVLGKSSELDFVGDCNGAGTGNSTEFFFVGECKADVIGKGTAKSRKARLVGDLVGDLDGEPGAMGKDNDEIALLGEAEARVRVKADILAGIASSGRSAKGIEGRGDASRLSCQRVTNMYI